MLTTHRSIRRSAAVLIGLEMGLAIAYFTTIVRQGAAPEFLDFNGLRTLPSLLQAVHLFTLGGLSLLILVFRNRTARPLSWFLPLALALLCFYGGLDEMTKLHLHLDQYNWQGIYLGLLIAIPVMGWRDLIMLWQHHRSTVWGVLIGLGIFLLGGFGAEMLKGAIATELAAHSTSEILFLTEHFRITVEELAELIGETVILCTFAQFLRQMLSSELSIPH